ncbi:hypothetical protein [Flavobacterium sp. XS2P39]|uniref:hypothetical protein n=1 Tax=Flavobacterium sp. XS2P39 TaxID=3401725 RepID=UPI003AB02EB6
MQIGKKPLKKIILLIHPVPATNIDILASVGFSDSKGIPEPLNIITLTITYKIKNSTVNISNSLVSINASILAKFLLGTPISLNPKKKKRTASKT